MSGPLAEVLVVGGGAAGTTAAEALRRDGFDGRITLLCGERHLPYDRPPLSKRVLSGEWEPGRATLRDAAAFAELDIEVRLGSAALRLDRADRAVELADGRRHRADAVVVATGVRPRPLSAGHDLAGVFTLRTVEDAVALREALAPGPRLVVAGAGLLGTEAAAVAAALGADVTLVSTQTVPLSGVLGREAAEALAGIRHGRGVRVRLGRAVAVEGTAGRTTGVRLAGGETVPADVVLVATGSLPNVEWLTGSGLHVGDGVRCDVDYSAGPGVWAAGDVAYRKDPATGRSRRVEHRSNATEGGLAVARGLFAGSGTPARTTTTVPYLWTDQCDLRVQVYGEPASADRAPVIDGSVEEGRFTALYGRDGRACAAVGMNMARAFGALRPLVTAGAPLAARQ